MHHYPFCQLIAAGTRSFEVQCERVAFRLRRNRCLQCPANISTMNAATNSQAQRPLDSVQDLKFELDQVFVRCKTAADYSGANAELISAIRRILYSHLLATVDSPACAGLLPVDRNSFVNNESLPASWSLSKEQASAGNGKIKQRCGHIFIQGQGVYSCRSVHNTRKSEAG